MLHKTTKTETRNEAQDDTTIASRFTSILCI